VLSEGSALKGIGDGYFGINAAAHLSGREWAMSAASIVVCALVIPMSALQVSAKAKHSEIASQLIDSTEA